MSRRLRTLHVITSSARRGAEVFAWQLAEPLRLRGLEVDLAALTEAPHAGSLPVPALGPTRFGQSTLRALRSRMSSADVVIAHGSSTLPATTIAGVGLSVPIVYRSISDSRAWTGAWHRNARVRTMLKRAAAVVALWDEAAQGLMARFGLPPARVHVIPNAVPADDFRPPTVPERAKAREWFGLAQFQHVVAMVGALSHEKAPDLAVHSMSELGSEAALLVVGDGPRRTGTEELAAKICPGRTVFTGAVARVVPAYWAADALILPSLTEGMPATPIEAALCGIPSAASKVGAVSEVVIEGRTGALFNAGDREGSIEAVRKVLADSQVLGAAARAYCKDRFDVEVIADLWADLLARIGRPDC